MDLEQFKDEYNLDHLDRIEPVGKQFKMWITPRFHEAYESGSYEDLMSNLLYNLASQTDLFIDVGAHYGYFTLLIGTANPQCKILAYEAAPENYEILRRNLDLNKLDQVLAFQRAISNRPGRALFNISTASDNCSFIEHPATPSLGQIEVETITLEQVLSSTPFTKAIIKIDTDGHELQVLEGAEAVLSASDDIQLIIELNPKCCYLAGSTPEALLTKLDELGYDCYFINEKEYRYYRPVNSGIDSWKSLFDEKSYANILCKKKARSTNVLIFSHSSELSGAERSLHELVTELASDYDTICTVILPSDGPLVAYLHKSAAATIVAPLNWWCTGGESLDQATIDRIYNPPFSWLLENRELMDLVNPDVVMTNTLVIPWGAVAASMLKRPHLWMINEFGESARNLKFFIPFSDILAFVEQSSDQIVTRSHAVQRELFPNVESNKVETIYRYIQKPETDETAGEAEKEYFLLPNACRLFMPGTIMSIKGQEDAVRSVIELVKNRGRNAELLMSGHAEENYRFRIEKIIRDEGAQEYIRMVPFDEHLISAYSAADIVLVCSRMDAFSRVILEAMLLEKPVVATSAGGNSELITDGETGLLYTPGEALQLADRIEMLMENPKMRAAIALGGKRFADQTFTKEQFGGEYSRLFNKITNTPYKSKAAVSEFVNPLFEFSFRQMEGKFTQQDEAVRTLSAQIDNLNDELGRTRRELDLAIAEVLSYARSTSWRITRPLRKLSRMIRGEKHA